jgi:hypothetical protein
MLNRSVSSVLYFDVFFSSDLTISRQMQIPLNLERMNSVRNRVHGATRCVTHAYQIVCSPLLSVQLSGYQLEHVG